MPSHRQTTGSGPEEASSLAPLLLFQKGTMHSTFIQKVMICMIAAFFTACLIQWAKVFVEGADDALNAGYKRDESAIFVSH